MAEPKTIQRLKELVDILATDRFKELKASDVGSGADFLLAITGTSDTELLEHLKTDHSVWIAAIAMYLEEWRYPQRPATPVQDKTKTPE